MLQTRRLPYNSDWDLTDELIEALQIPMVRCPGDSDRRAVAAPGDKVCRAVPTWSRRLGEFTFARFWQNRLEPAHFLQARRSVPEQVLKMHPTNQFTWRETKVFYVA